MDNLNLISNFAEFKELKNIDKATMIGVLEDVFRHALQKQFETDENFDVIINPEKGDLEIWRNRTVVEDGAVENPNMQIAVSEVKAIDPTYEVGDEYVDPIKLESFGRRAVLSLRQNLASRILDLEKANLYEKYSEKVGEIITGEVILRIVRADAKIARMLDVSRNTPLLGTWGKVFLGDGQLLHVCNQIGYGENFEFIVR